MSVKLILLRHGQSTWNSLNLFTGWVDVPLSSKGVEEALLAGKLIQNEPIDIIFTSSLIRAQMTAMLAMNGHVSGKVPVILHERDEELEHWSLIHSEETKKDTIPVYAAWELNERMYGDLQGRNKKELADLYGAEQIQIWRRSFDIPPPNGESLKMTADRTLPYFKNIILPYLKSGKNVFIAAHGNSLRSIMMMLDSLTPDEVVKLELATGVPVIYEYEEDHFVKLTTKH
ncbi:MAG: 2,3-bisphosphoglycerate-dependent phosphoglycerate mutase [Parachlamydiaceae bacterium]|nr:2,3-bisphosphoglycerate-dependent phosphoglycerate mutase [Parachlamydiaceae bacterium]